MKFEGNKFGICWISILRVKKTTNDDIPFVLTGFRDGSNSSEDLRAQFDAFVAHSNVEVGIRFFELFQTNYYVFYQFSFLNPAFGYCCFEDYVTADVVVSAS